MGSTNSTSSRAVAFGYALGVVLSVLHYGHIVHLFADLQFRSPILDRHLEEWHRRCDTHVGQPAETPETRDCARELHELTIYADMKGMTSKVEALTAYAKQIGWSRE